MRDVFLLVVLLAARGLAADLVLPVRDAGGPVPLDPADRAWSKASAVTVPLMPQTIAPPGGGGAVADIRVAALRGAGAVGLRLEWADAAADDDASAPERFGDAVALQLPRDAGTRPSPFMGDAAHPVTIWRWSASAQKDLDGGWRRNDAVRPRLAIGYYSLPDDPAFRAGEAAGNPVSRRERTSPVDALVAGGFGTITIAPVQPVLGKGVRTATGWAVVMRADVKDAPALAGPGELPFAVAAWDGAGKERNGMKSVSVWQTLVLGDVPPAAAADPAARGRRVFERYGCGTCHGPAALGGVSNPNAQFDPIPALNRVKEQFTKEEVQQVIFKGREPARKDAAGPPAPFRMNAWERILGQDEADDLVAYLFSLMPKAKAGEEW